MVAECKQVKGLKWYWFSFSFQGKNQGCCNVKAENKEEALQKTIDLGIRPKHDDIASFEITCPELPPDRLFTKDELIAMDYEPVTS